MEGETLVKIGLFVIGVGVITVWFIGFIGMYGVDEEGFCRDKVATYYPELDTRGCENNGVYAEQDGCIVSYIANETEIRDGLREHQSCEELKLDLINQDDVDYLGSDDWYMWLIGMVGVMILMVWLLVMWE